MNDFKAKCLRFYSYTKFYTTYLTTETYRLILKEGDRLLEGRLGERDRLRAGCGDRECLRIDRERDLTTKTTLISKLIYTD